MKMKRFLLSFLLLSAVFVASAQPDSLDYRCSYYTWRRDLQEGSPVGRHHVVMLGNSLTERGYWSEYFQRSQVLNRGIGGDCVSGMIARLGAIVEGQPKAIFIMAGVNDLIFSTISPEALLAQYARMVAQIRLRTPRTKIYIESLLPLDEEQNTQYFTGKNLRIAAFNRLLQGFAREQKLTYIDIWGQIQQDGKLPKEYTIDGIHLNAEGYREWVAALQPYLKK